ncbi:MAG TPA: phosphatidylglycerophosphatase A, partial [Alphaproteobacteria bacterium]
IAMMMSEAGKAALILAFLISCVAGWWAIEQIQEKTQTHDDGWIVIDEWAGVWLAMIFSGPHFVQVFLCLALFRLFDIWKPGPIRWLDKNVHGPVGVMIDDLAAGLATAVCVWGIGWIL